MRILYIINSMEGGGAERALYNLVAELRSQSNDILIEVVTLYSVGPFGDMMEKSGVKIDCLSLRSKYSAKGIYRVRKRISQSNYDLVHAHLFPASYYSALALQGDKALPLLFTEHSVWNRRRAIGGIRYIDSIIYRRFSRIITVGNRVASDLITWLPSVESKITVIPNGVPVPNLEPFDRAVVINPRESSVPTVLFVGRLTYVKGVDILIRAISLIKEMDFQLLIVGDGEQRTRLEDMASALSIKEKIAFLGFQTDLLQLIDQARFLVMPSRWEGLPLAILEAMALGKPVVAATVGSIPEVVREDVTGKLVPPGDEKLLANAIRYMLLNRTHAEKMGRNARKLIEREHSIVSVSARTNQLYQEILRK